MASAIPKSSPFFPLTDDAVGRIFTFVAADPKDYARFAEVCKVCHAIVVNHGRLPLAMAYRGLLPNLEKQAISWASAECEPVHLSSAYDCGRLQFVDDAKAYKLRIAAHFHIMFDLSLDELKISLKHPNFNAYVLAAQKIMSFYMKERKIPTQKIEKCIKTFNNCIITTIAYNFSRPLVKITPASFKERVAWIQKNFEGMNLIQIETKLRVPIYDFHVEFPLLIAAYSVPNDQWPQFLTIREVIQSELKSKKEAFENELKKLRGPSGCNGTIQKAYDAMEQAKKKTLPESTHCITIQDVSESNELGAKYVVVGQESQDFENRKKAYEALLEKEQEIERIEPGPTPIKKGQLPDVIVALKPAHLEAAAHAEMQKMANFYTELCNVVTKTNRVQRSAALHQIID